MEKAEMHARNRHRNRYDFPKLIESSPELSPFVRKNEHGDESIDFADPSAVKTLNRAILRLFYSVKDWDIPENYLCPPIPGRADYLHHAADLLSRSNGGKIPKGSAVRILDIGTGANGVYPLIGNREYGWSFVGTDIDPVALKAFEKTLEKNPDLEEAIELRLQKNPSRVFEGVVSKDETFDLTLCNPPFHASREDAEMGSRRKWKNLGKEKAKGPPVRNFGGTNSELWCEGGERAFISGMIEESAKYAEQCRWFTTLVAKETHLPAIQSALERAKVREHLTIETAQGQKKSRIVAWTFATSASSRSR